MNIDRKRLTTEKSSWIAQAILFIFLASGALYLFFPEQHYNIYGWGVLIKYIIYTILILFLSFYIINNGKILISSIIICILWIVSINISIIYGTEIDRAMLYLIPAFSILAPPSFQIKSVKLAFPLLLLTGLGAVYEYFVLGGFPRFHPTSYRGISIFINPNNLGFVATILTAYIILTHKGILRLISIILGCALILYSGSKTGMIIFLIMNLIVVTKSNFIRVFQFGIPIIALAIASVVVGIVKIPLESTWQRFEQYRDFFANIDNIIFPFLDNRVYYADNAFIQMWIELGLPSLVVYIGVLILCAAKERLNSPLWAVFALASLTTNIPYLFPPAYMFWFYVGTVMRGTSPVIEPRKGDPAPSS